jgi:hypothetical protein
MISTNMDSLLNANLDGSAASFSMIAGYKTPDPTTHDAYFFLRRELEVTDIKKYYKAWDEKKIRHCKPYRGHWLDYTARKEFTTLEEWVKDAGDTMENVLYGVNRVHKQDAHASFMAGKFVGKPEAPKYVTLEKVLEYYGYVAPPVVDSFTDIAIELNMKITQEGGKCLVKKSDGVIVVGKIIDIRYSIYSSKPTQVCILVPKTTNSGPCIAYESMSDLPRGTTIYFRTDDGFFHPAEELMKE